MRQLGMAPTPFRRARTRTLIQLGALIEKAGLIEELDIVIGSDLQKDPDMRQPIYTLYGALLELKSMFQSGDLSPSLLAIKGGEAFGRREIPNLLKLGKRRIRGKIKA